MPYHAKPALHLKPTHEILLTRMLFTLGLAATTVGVSLYFIKLGLPDSMIGILVGAQSLAIAGISLLLPPLLEKYNQLKLIIFSSLLTALSFGLFGFSRSAILALLFIFLSNIGVTINLYSLSILFKDSTRSKNEFTRDTGLMGSLINFSWFVGPLLGGLMLNYAGLRGLFVLASILCVINATFIFIMPFKTTVKNRDSIDGNIKENVLFFLSRRQLRIAYFQNMGIAIWWGFIWTFIPILMTRANYSVASVGIFVAVSQLPLFLLEFKTVNILKKVSFRTVFTVSYGLLAAICVFAFFTPLFSTVLLALLCGSLLLSFIEPISDIFFFGQVSKLEEEKTYPIYGTASPIGNTFVKVGVGAALAIFADKAAFLVLAALLLYVSFAASKIRQTE